MTSDVEVVRMNSKINIDYAEYSFVTASFNDASDVVNKVYMNGPACQVVTLMSRVNLEDV